MRIGEVKFRISRLQTYATVVATAVNVSASFVILGLSYWWALVAIPFLYALHWLDKHYVHPHESATMLNENAEWMKTKKKIDEIHSRIYER